ncbi:MAG: hypothetical protein ACI4K7_03720 [Oscillospiraceae bacterium]
MSEKIYKIHMGKANCAVDLGDGSERGEYVDQDYIINKLGRPHRSVSLMYCYYPNDKGWPVRASEAFSSENVSFQWDYPYDDYFTYKGGIGGTLDDEPFTCMRDVRRHGQDVTLTLTIDPTLDDEHLIAIAKDLSTFGRMILRINHEATGDWFSFTKRASYGDIAKFFVHFTDIIHEYAPNVKTLMCIGGIENLDKTEMEMEEEFRCVVPAADMWSVDKYMALHWGWPYDVAERGGNSHSRSKVSDTYEKTKRSFERFKFLNGGEGKPMSMAEFNADGDVTGPYEQAEMVKEFCDILVKDNAKWFTSFTMYQFRDRGRLGLEIEDPNNPNVGIEQPLMKTYKEIIHSDWFSPSMDEEGEAQFPIKLRWGGAEDAEGIAIPVHFEKNPHFCEVVFEDDGNYMLELNGKWFYKAPGTKTVDLMGAFFEKPLDGKCDMTLKLFAPPATGENDPSQGDDWAENYYAVVEKLPKIRVRFEPVEL